MLQEAALLVDDAALEGRLCALLANLPDVLARTLHRKGFLWERIGKETCDLFIVSRELLPKPERESVQLLRQLPDNPAVVVLARQEDSEERARLLAAGCEAVLNVSLSQEMLGAVLSTILEKRRAIADEQLSGGPPLSKSRLSDFVSASPAMQAFMSVVHRVVHSDSSLLILGETGVGKERLARAMHAEGPRGKGPFITVNCGALPDTLLESELFGHEEGAFTGATRARRGMFELAHRGTLFLDEIGETPLHLQVKLLRAVQEREIQRLGGERPITVDVRVVAATNHDLARDVEARRFRSDLFYRLGVVTLTIPPLRERREDVPALVESYLDHLGPRLGRSVTGISDDALDALARYAWPGNVRELINVIERAMLLCSTNEITLKDLPGTISGRYTPVSLPAQGAAPDPGALPTEWTQRPLREVRQEAVAGLERAYLAALLRATGGRIAETARRAGLGPRALHGKMRRLGLRKEDFKAPAAP